LGSQESAVLLDALRRQPRAAPGAGFGAPAAPGGGGAHGALAADGAAPMDADVGPHGALLPPSAPATPPDWKDVDAAHAEDPLFVGAYVGDIYAYLRTAELKHRPSTRYMDAVQVDINATMRGILVDWLVEVAEEYKLVPDTLFLSVAYIDRCLSAHVVQRAQLQLVGVTCMLIAAKYEEIYAPQVDEFCYITDNTYTREQVLAMERKVLDTLSFELTTPTAKSFLRRFLRAAEADQKAEFLACFLAELSLLDYAFLRFAPSAVAASCVLVAQWALRRPAWSPTLAHYAGYVPAQLRECATALAELLAGARRSSLPAVREKYSQHKFKCVACVVPPEGGIPDAVWEL
jgi:cyclin A